MNKQEKVNYRMKQKHLNRQKILKAMKLTMRINKQRQMSPIYNQLQKMFKQMNNL